MSDRSQQDVFDARDPDRFRLFPPLPPWLARRLLRPDERVTWVRGPRFNPWWERYVTHPALFLLALALGAACLGAARLIAGSWAAVPAPPALIAGGLVLA